MLGASARRGRDEQLRREPSTREHRLECSRGARDEEERRRAAQRAVDEVGGLHDRGEREREVHRDALLRRLARTRAARRVLRRSGALVRGGGRKEQR